MSFFMLFISEILFAIAFPLVLLDSLTFLFFLIFLIYLFIFIFYFFFFILQVSTLLSKVL